MVLAFGALNLSRGQLQLMIYKKRAWLGALWFNVHLWKYGNLAIYYFGGLRSILPQFVEVR